jgi:hypothetical protein
MAAARTTSDTPSTVDMAEAVITVVEVITVRA